MKGNTDRVRRTLATAAALVLAALALAGLPQQRVQCPGDRQPGTSSAAGASADPGRMPGPAPAPAAGKSHYCGVRDPVAEPVGGLRAQPR